MPKYRILFLDHTAILSGAERSLLDLILRLNTRQYEPIFVCPREGPLAEELRQNHIEVKIIPVPEGILETEREEICHNPCKLCIKLFQIIVPILKLSKFVRENKIYILHANTLKACLLGLIAGKIGGAKVVWHVRDILPDGFAKKLFLFFSMFTTKIIVISNAVRTAFIKADKRMVTIYNGIDINQLVAETRQDVRNQFNISENYFVIGMVGQITPLKGQRYFFEAASQVLKTVQNVRFLVVGDVMFKKDMNIAYKMELVNLVKKLHVSQEVIFTGYRADVLDIIDTFNILVHPAVLPEAFGRVLIEAMALKKPVIATNIGGLQEIVGDGVTGFLVPPKNPEAIAEKVIQLLRDRHKTKEMGKAGYERVSQLFDINNTVKKVQQIYEEILGMKPRSS